ncbi:hypothetical protein [Capnocytophaga granulosa]|uniref:hypothetical protein n=1 Tax=Capnocytophaga granulosa TaxID=45242 RepID=UPI00204E7BEC|nr:hypothetical protein [Capnocytophaga granulosa]DAY22100.1 MAG TPA: hypothetical protein [Caudoviricetes sp.]
MKFITELRARGLQITEKEAKYLMEIAVADYRESQVKPILKRENMAHYLILALAFCDATHELMCMVDESNLKYKLKSNFKNVKKYNGEVVEEFNKFNKQDTSLLNAFRAYADDISELVYLHLDGINNKDKANEKTN